MPTAPATKYPTTDKAIDATFKTLVKTHHTHVAASTTKTICDAKIGAWELAGLGVEKVLALALAGITLNPKPETSPVRYCRATKTYRCNPSVSVIHLSSIGTNGSSKMDFDVVVGATYVVVIFYFFRAPRRLVLAR